MSDKNRLIEREMKGTYQEKFIEELSCVVSDQWKSVEEISKKLMF
ncbi:SlyX protein [Bartonella sp. B1099]|nr:SlyX protein [Bartonella sp. B1099]